jgi:hypothetical protein
MASGPRGVSDDVFHPGQAPVTEYLVPELRYGTVLLVQLRYNFRVYPTPGQQIELGRVFGCARVVFNDGLRARQEAREQGPPYVSDAELSKRIITQAKDTPQRAWLGEVSAVVLQQALADLNRAYPCGWPRPGGTGSTNCPRRSSARTKRCMSRICASLVSAGPDWRSPCMMRAGRRSPRCWSTRPPDTGARSPGSTGSSHPPACAATAAGSTRRWHCTSERGTAPAEQPTTAT